MDSSSNDPLYYLKVIAEYATLRQERIAKARKALPWILAGVAIYVVAMLAIPYYVGQVGRGALETKNEPNWNGVCSARNQGDLSKALEITDQMLAKNPGDFDGHYKKGEILLMLGDKEASLKSFQTAYDIFPITKYRDAVNALKPKPVKAVNGNGTPVAPAGAPAKAKP